MPTVPPQPARTQRGRRLFATVALAMALAMLGAAGCSCRAETAAERAAREARETEEERQRRELEQAKLAVVLPAPTTLPAAGASGSLVMKPGHWGVVSQPVKANAAEFDGVLTQGIVTRDGDPVPVALTATTVVSERTVVLAAQGAKSVDALVFFPNGDAPPRLRTAVRERRSGASAYDSASPTRPLLDHQYQVVVLAKEASRYAFLDSLYAVNATLPTSVDADAIQRGAAGLPAAKNYRVAAVAMDGAGVAPLPDHFAAWTSIAYVVWDEVDPERLRPEQRDALVDWINWGGQLLVSGPDSLDLLRGSFLDPLLPADATGAADLDAADRAALAEAWGVATQGTRLEPVGKRDWSGVRLKPRPGSVALAGPKGRLFERRVGRGRVVVSGFRLTEPALLNWKRGVENLFNAGLLRRPARRFVAGAYDGDRVVTLWATGDTLARDPLRNTGLRTFVRDTHADPALLTLQLVTEGDPAAGLSRPGALRVIAPAGDEGFRRLAPPVVRGGAGAWNDHGPVATAARQALRRSAGVSIPDAGFVAWWLAGYLVLLAPCNWLFFHALGRVELAWVAAPLLAVVAAVVVVRQAQLDIGFVRAQTEVAVLEVQPDTPRGLLTRFSAFYTSLSTSYDLEYDDATAVAAPFSRYEPTEKLPPAQRTAEVVFERQERSRLKGLAVASASTEFVRSEEMVNLARAVPKGSSRVGRVGMGVNDRGLPRVENLTHWPMTEVAVVERPGEGPPMLRGCWIGALPAGKSATVSFAPVALTEGKAPFAVERQAARGDAPEVTDRLDLSALAALALDPERMAPGERRLVGRIDEPLPGVTVQPAASQRRGATLVVAHLGYGPLPLPDRDKNAPADVALRGGEVMSDE